MKRRSDQDWGGKVEGDGDVDPKFIEGYSVERCNVGRHRA